jgi:hypothetical protein
MSASALEISRKRCDGVALGDWECILVKYVNYKIHYPFHLWIDISFRMILDKQLTVKFTETQH